jgi:hypothetical protein
MDMGLMPDSSVNTRPFSDGVEFRQACRAKTPPSLYFVKFSGKGLHFS